MNDWEIQERLTKQELAEELEKLNETHAGRLVRLKKNGDIYRIHGFSVLNHNGMAEYCVDYHPFSVIEKREYEKIKHRRPAREFFDGRFEF